MKDTETISRIREILCPDAGRMFGVSRGSRLLLALPEESLATAKALALYQPQRIPGRAMAGVLKLLSKHGWHRIILPIIDSGAKNASISSQFASIDPDSCGILLGSPEHSVRRAVASYNNSGVWEVAKISFGNKGEENLEREADVLGSFQNKTSGVPAILGLHRSGDATILRMPYLTGRAIGPKDLDSVLNLLESWISCEPTRPIYGFPEWKAIYTTLEGRGARGKAALETISSAMLQPVIRHGDFARWNLLKQADGSLLALDWEWGHSAGMPGLDLIHYFLQDARLVKRLKPAESIEQTMDCLKNTSTSRYLHQTGWATQLLLCIITSLAYKQGSGHQDNAFVLDTALSLFKP